MNDLWHLLSLFPYFTLIGFFTAYTARKKGKNPYLWFFIGFGFGLFGLIGAFLMRKKEPAPKRERGILLCKENLYPWYLGINGKTEGPFSRVKIEDLYAKSKIDLETMIWNESLDNWIKLKELPDLTILD